MTDRSQLLRRQLRTRILSALLLISAGYFFLPVVSVWLGFLPHPGTAVLDRSLSAAFVLGLPVVACWAHLKTLGDALSADSEHGGDGA